MSHGRTNTQLRAALLERLGITQQALSARAIKKNKAHQLSTPESMYLIAHEEGLELAKYLGPEELKNAREAISHASAVSTAAAPRLKTKAAKKTGRPVERKIRLPSQKKISASLLSNTEISEAIDMSEIYPFIYLIENSMRKIVCKVLEEEFGPDWWDKALVSANAKAVVTKAADRMQSEATMRKWHQRRGGHPIYYIDLDDLAVIIFSRRAHFFPEPLGDDSWFSNFIKELVASRNVLCHMNPLDKDNMKDLELKYARWCKIAEHYIDSHSSYS